jgi:Phospholipid N-methyltransferase
MFDRIVYASDWTVLFRKLVEQFRDALNSGSTIVQMSYTPFIKQIRLFDGLQREGFSVQRVSTVFFNIPPASVFVLRKV